MKLAVLPPFPSWVIALIATACATQAPQQRTPAPAPSSPALPPPPSLQWPVHSNGYPALPARFEGLIVKVTIDAATLLEPVRPGLRRGEDVYVLLMPGQLGRVLVMPTGSPLTVADARQLGVDAVAAVVEIERDLSAKTCTAETPQLVCIRGLQRLDAGARYAIDVGATLAELITAYTPSKPEGRTLADQAQQAFAVHPDPADARVVPPLGYPPFFPLGFAAQWAAERKELEVLLVARADRTTVRRVVNPDPHAGTYGCDAPPGADCAPSCRPPGFSIVAVQIAEAGLRAVFDRSGQRRQLTAVGSGLHPPHELDRRDEPCP